MADTNAADEQKPAGENGEGAADDASNEDGTGGDDSGGNKTDDDSPGDPDDGVEPETRRKTPKDYIIERKNRQLEKAKAQKPEAKDDDKGDTDDGDDGDIVPEDEELIKKVVEKSLAPFMEREQKAKDDADVAEFLSKNPDFKPFEAKARRYIQHPSRRDLPVKAVFYEVAGDALLRIGAQRAKNASDEAAHGRAGGGSDRGMSGGKSAKDMTTEEFRAKKDSVRMRAADR